MNCTKCGTELVYVVPSHTLRHLGTDYWTKIGERRMFPKICMECRSKVGRHAQSYQQNLVTDK
jgi:hypothetical protein